LAKTNREQNLIVHALFGKWNLLCRLALTQNDMGRFVRYAMTGGRRAKVDRCDRDHIRIEELPILVFNNVIAAFA
jgi:hypothetical protein